MGLGSAGFCQLHQVDTVLLLMGSRFEIAAIHQHKKNAKDALVAAIKEIDRIENLISTWKPSSQTSAINKAAGIQPVKVDREVFNLVSRAKKVSELTGGAFDISFGPLGDAWNIAGKMGRIPDTSAIDAALPLVNYQNIVLNREQQSVFLAKKGMKIGFGALGKGYSANRAKKIMVAAGIKSGLVNAGGDLTAWGNQPNGAPWKIGIADPEKKTRYAAWLEVNEACVATSGNYEKFFEVNGVKYSHIINPQTGYPAQGIKSVTILCPDAELADALATSVFVLGVEKGLELVNRLKHAECLILDNQNKFWQSYGLNLSFY